MLPLVDLLIDVVQGQTSVLGKRPLEPTDLSWLEEVHKKIWKQEGLESELFREVEVTQEDYVELQKRLQELRPDRDSPDYDGFDPGSDVLRVKLDFLLSLNRAKSLSPLHPDDNDNLNQVQDDGDEEAKNKDDGARNKGGDSEPSNKRDDSEAINEDDIVLESLFPCILKFLDLSTLGIESVDVTPLGFPLLHRQEYEDISKLIEDKPQSNGGSVLISGQPGIGEFLVSLSHTV